MVADEIDEFVKLVKEQARPTADENEVRAMFEDLRCQSSDDCARRFEYVLTKFQIWPKIECEDGFSMSVQAKPGTWCRPGGMDRYSSEFEPQPEAYTHVEVGFPSALEELLLPYAEDENYPTDTIYMYVPAHLILTVISKHGGMVGGELPPLNSDD